MLALSRELEVAREHYSASDRIHSPTLAFNGTVLEADVTGEQLLIHVQFRNSVSESFDVVCHVI